MARARSDNRQSHPAYPQWVCAECGRRYSRRIRTGSNFSVCNEYATWHHGECGVCGQSENVTEPRDFGHLTDDWEQHAKRKAVKR